MVPGDESRLPFLHFQEHLPKSAYKSLGLREAASRSNVVGKALRPEDSAPGSQHHQPAERSGTAYFPFLSLDFLVGKRS